MRRNFKLDEITAGAFARLWNESEKPPKRHYCNPRGYNNPRYFSIHDRTGYETFEELIESLPDGRQIPRCIWFANGDVSIGVATERTMESCPKYWRKLFGHSSDERLKTLVVQMARRFSDHPFNDDLFNFRRDKCFWYVDHLHIKRKNFKLYTLEGTFPRITKATPAVSGIYPVRAHACAH